MDTLKGFEQMALMDNPQIIFKENLSPKKAGASSHTVSTLTHVEIIGQDKTAAKTLHRLHERCYHPNLWFPVFCAANKDDHACFKLHNWVTAKKVIWSFALSAA